MPEDARPATPQNILLFKLGALGDVILSMPTMRRIRLYYRTPQARITVLTSPPYAELFRRCPYVDEVWLDPRKPIWRFHHFVAVARQLKYGGFDALYDLQGNRHTRRYHRWALGTLPYCHNPTERELPLPQPPPASIDLSPWIADDVQTILHRHRIGDGFVLLIPGSSARNAHKRWPFFDSLAKRLRADGWQLVTAPGPDDIACCRALPATMLLDGGHPLSLFQLAGLCAHASLVVGNDTGPTHLAVHCGAASVVLYGVPGMAERIGTAQHSAAIEAVGIKSISPAEVHRAASRALSSYPEPA